MHENVEILNGLTATILQYLENTELDDFDVPSVIANFYRDYHNCPKHFDTLCQILKDSPDYELVGEWGELGEYSFTIDVSESEFVSIVFRPYNEMYAYDVNLCRRLAQIATGSLCSCPDVIRDYYRGELQL